MADFAERLPLTEGTNRVIADEANPSAMASVLEFAGQALQGYQQIKQDVAKTKARRKAEEEKSTEAQIAYDVTGAHDAARQIVTDSGRVRAEGQQALDQFGQLSLAAGSTEIDAQGAALSDTFEDKLSPFYVPPEDVSPAMEREVQASATRAASVVAAVEQGRMPEISMNSALSARFRQLREKYPEHTEYLLDVWKKTGLDANLFSEARDALYEVDENRKAASKARNDKLELRNRAIATGRENMGAAALTMSDDDLEINGLEAMRISGELQRSVQRADLAQKVAAGSQEAATFAQTTLDQEIETNLGISVYNKALPVIRTIGGLVDSLSRNPNDSDSLIEFQRQGPMVNQLVHQIVNNAVAQAQGAGYKGDPEKLRTSLSSRFKGLTDAFTGDQSVVASNISALKAVETAFAIDGHKALPVFMGLKQLGIKPDAMPGLMRAVETNPVLQKSLNAEINGYLSDWGRDRASTSLVNVVKLLRGETTFARMEAGAARSAIGGLTAATDKIASDYVAGKDIDPDMVLNGFGEIVIAATALTPSSGANPIYVATKGFADAGSRAALIKALGDPKLATEDREMALATVQASRAGSAHLLNNIGQAMGKANEASPYFKMVWDSNDGKYKVQSTPALAELKKRGGMSGAYVSKYGNAITPAMRNAAANMQAPDVIQKLIKAANLNLDNAIALGPHDPSTPQATEKQLRNWYGRNIPIPGERAAGAKSVDPNKELGKQIDSLREMTTQVFDLATKPVDLPKRASGKSRDYTKAPRYSEIAPVVESAASKYNVPAKIALALVGKESTFDPSAEGPVIKKGTHKGDKAMGLGQVMAKTAAAYGVTDRASLTPAQQADLSMRVLSDNYKTTGNWRDAVSMYFTGVRYATAAANPQKYNDGANTVDEYLGDIL